MGNTYYIVRFVKQYDKSYYYYGSTDAISGTCVVEPLREYAQAFDTIKDAENYADKHKDYLKQFNIKDIQIMQVKTDVIKTVNLTE